jgi:FKBP-type peptidyl-prolyl cis-trans isomerase
LIIQIQQVYDAAHMKRALILLFFTLFIGMVCTSCKGSNKAARRVSQGSTVTTSTGLVYQVIVAGKGPAARPGQAVRIHETTTLADGTLIYSTRTKNNPLKFLLGGNQVIAGVDEGVTGMKVGERRKLVVPPSLSKRSAYPANTPPDATLYYDIELVEILDK